MKKINRKILMAAFYEQYRTPPRGIDSKVGCITATIDKGYDGYGTRPCILEYEETDNGNADKA